MDSALKEKPYAVQMPAESEGKIVLSIEEGAVPAALLKEVKSSARSAGAKSFLSRADEFLRSLGSPKPKDKATFFRLLSIMINAGIPLIRSLDTIGEQTVNHKLKNAVFEVSRAIEKGGKFSESLERYPRIFSEAQIGMIRSGEASGQLNKILKELAIEVEKSAAIARKVKSAMMYPLFIVIVMVIVIAVMMIMVVPKISEIFLESGNKLPLLTRVVIAMSNFMRERWALLFGTLAGVIAAASFARRTRQGKYATDWLILHIPLFGGLVKKSILARFARSLGNLLASGIPIILGLNINAKGVGNVIYEKRIQLAAEDLERGIPLGESLRDSPEFPGMMVQMIAVGEQTAQLDNIASKIAEYYEDEVDAAVAGLSKAIEPVILLIVGTVVGLIVGAVMMPIIQLSNISGAL